MYAGNVGIVRSLGIIVAPFVLAGLSACGHTSDPAVPCDQIQLGEARAGTVAAAVDAPILAISDNPRPYVVHPVCDVDGCRWMRSFLQDDADEADDAERDGDAGDDDEPRPGKDHAIGDDTVVSAAKPVGREAAATVGTAGTKDGAAAGDETSPLDPLTGGSGVLLTSTGRYVVAIDAESPVFRTWEIDPWAEPPVRQVYKGGIQRSDALVLVVGLRGSDTIVARNSELELGSVDPRNATFETIAEGRPDLKVVAVGDDHIIGREIVDGERDRVVLVPVTRDAPGFFEGPVELATVPSLSRVELTAGDEFVVLTAGSGDDTETFVFSVPDGALVDRFLGGAVPGVSRLDALPGLRATSPDGSHLAYRTASGALALRDLQGATSCLVRSASGGDHSVAGFAADAMLYMQADQDLGNSHVFAFDTASRTLSALDAADRGHHLVGAPPHLADRRRPWAIGVRDGSYSALQDGAPAASLGLEGPVFLPRSDDRSALWLADKYDDGANQTRFGVRRFEPEFVGRTYSFTTADDRDSVPEVFASVDDDTPLGPGLSRLGPGERPCVSTGTPGGWAYQCKNASSAQGFLAAAGLPSTEGASSLLDPEVPDPPEPVDPDDEDE